VFCLLITVAGVTFSSVVVVAEMSVMAEAHLVNDKLSISSGHNSVSVFRRTNEYSDVSVVVSPELDQVCCFTALTL